MSNELSSHDVQAIRRAFERVSGQGWGVALGVLAALGLFIATIVLVVKSGPLVGPHLGLLRMYFPGYAVTWTGAFVGAMYAFVCGYAVGRSVAAIYNRLVDRM